MSILRLIRTYSKTYIRAIPASIAPRVEIIYCPSNDRYLYDPASVAADDDGATLKPSSIKDPGRPGRWRRQVASSGGIVPVSTYDPVTDPFLVGLR